MDSEVFEFSGLPNYIEWYKCYDDPSAKAWIDGMELRKERSTWDQRSIDKWNFFYRPFPPAVGRPQKKRIQQRMAVISTCKAYIEQTNSLLESLAREFRGQFRNAAVQVLVLAILSVGLWAYHQTLLTALGAFVAVAVLWRLHQVHGRNRSQLAGLTERLRQYQELLSLNESEVVKLEDEIRHLHSKMPGFFDAATIQSWLGDEIRQLELICLGEFLSEPVTEEVAKKLIGREFGDRRVLGILIDSWGYLQPSMLRGPLGKESTGLRRAYGDLGDRLSTWQVGYGGAPMFRLWYLQFMLPLERNLNICSFFFDFVTRRSYGRRWETFQYNHVTSFSIREVDPEEEDWASGAESISGTLAEGACKALTIATSSGVQFRCVIVDEDLAGYFNGRLKNEEKLRELTEDLSRTDESKATFDGGDVQLNGWRDEERQRLIEEIKSLTMSRRAIEFGTAVKTRAMLGEVRKCVEGYVSRTEAKSSRSD